MSARWFVVPALVSFVALLATVNVTGAVSTSSTDSTTITAGPVSASSTDASTTTSVAPRAPLNKYAASPDQVCTPTVPKPGFDPTTTSNADLVASDDFPPRPDTPTALAAWNGYVKMYLAGQGTTCVGFGLYNSPDARTLGATATWSGWAAHNYFYTDVGATFGITLTTGGGLETYQLSDWDSINIEPCNGALPCVDPLVQAGVVYRADGPLTGPGHCEVIWEVFPQVVPWVDLGPCSWNDTIYSHPSVTTAGVVYIHVWDETNGGDYVVPNHTYYENNVSGTTIRPDGHAEAITEELDSSLPSFYPIPFTGAKALSPTTGWQTIDALPNYTYWAEGLGGASDVLMSPSGISSGDFTNNFVSSGP